MYALIVFLPLVGSVLAGLLSLNNHADTVLLKQTRTRSKGLVLFIDEALYILLCALDPQRAHNSGISKEYFLSGGFTQTLFWSGVNIYVKMCVWDGFVIFFRFLHAKPFRIM